MSVVVCMRIADRAIPSNSEATEGMCGECSAPVWMSPASRASVEGGADLRCAQCATAMLGKDPEGDVIANERGEPLPSPLGSLIAERMTDRWGA